LDAIPSTPSWPGQERFEGGLIHAADFKNAAPFVGLDVLVVGCGNSGSEIAALLADGGATRVRVAIRTPPNMFPRFALGLPLYPAAVVLEKLPTRVADGAGRLTQRLFYGDLSEFGLSLPELGAKSTVYRRGIGPTIEDRFVEAVKSDRIQIVSTVERFDGKDVLLADGSRIRPDAVIAATGYRTNLESLVGHLVELDAIDRPVVNRDQSAPGAPGLFFSGYWSGVCGPLRRMRREARQIAKAAAQRDDFSPIRRPSRLRIRRRRPSRAAAST
jgi:putative flavoprotein involved in K+ transport